MKRFLFIVPVLTMLAACASTAKDYFDSGDYDRAITEYNKDINRDPNDAVAYSNRGLAYSKKGNYDQAIADISEAIRLAPNFVIAYINRGDAYMRKKTTTRLSRT